MRPYLKHQGAEAPKADASTPFRFNLRFFFESFIH
jgi:hypothetical protein